jgi:hypothetical protein
MCSDEDQMNNIRSATWGLDLTPKMYIPLTDKELPIRLQELINSEPDRFLSLQRYIDEPPGEDMAVIYAEVSPSGKIYIGQHCHGKEAKSYSKTRMFKHEKCPACTNAYNKYGIENFRVFIIDHCRAGNRGILPAPDDSNGLEMFYISDDGLDTLSPNGYNLQIGGYGGPLHPETIERMKITKNLPEVKEKVSKSIKTAMSTTEFKEWRSNTSKKMWKDEDYRQKHAKAMKISKVDPVYLQRQSEASKKMWKDEDYRQKHAKAMAAVNADPDVLAKRGASIRQAFTSTDTKRKHSNGIKKAKKKRMKEILLPAVRAAFEILWNNGNGNLNARGVTMINERDMGKVCKKIRSRFDYVLHCPELAVWLKERGFKMNAVDEVKNAQKWTELEQKWAEVQQV